MHAEMIIASFQMKFILSAIAFICIILNCSAFVINADKPIADESMAHECGNANMSEVSIIVH